MRKIFTITALSTFILCFACKDNAKPTNSEPQKTSLTRSVVVCCDNYDSLKKVSYNVSANDIDDILEIVMSSYPNRIDYLSSTQARLHFDSVMQQISLLDSNNSMLTEISVLGPDSLKPYAVFPIDIQEQRNQHVTITYIETANERAKFTISDTLPSARRSELLNMNFKTLKILHGMVSYN